MATPGPWTWGLLYLRGPWSGNVGPGGHGRGVVWGAEIRLEAMNSWLWVALGGAGGAVARFAVSARLGTVGGSGFPVGTLVVNVVGCLVIGYLLGFGESRSWMGERARWFLVSGFLGSFTTFSTFGHETLSLVDRGQSVMAAGYVAASLAASGVAILVGVWSAKQFG